MIVSQKKNNNIYYYNLIPNKNYKICYIFNYDCIPKKYILLQSNT